MESLGPLWEIQRDAHGLLNAHKGGRREGAERRMDCQAFIECGHLIALGPRIFRQAGLSGQQFGSQGKLLVFDPGNGYDADVQGKAIERVGGDYERGPFLVQGE
jgi:hypothetical protein